MIRNVIFDLGGVLLDLDMERCFENVRALGVDMDALTSNSTAHEENASLAPEPGEVPLAPEPGEVPLAPEPGEEGSTMCDGVKVIGVMHQYQIGKVATDEFISGLAKLGRPGTTCQQALDAWNSCLLTIPEYKLDFARELREKGYRVYMLSNTNDAHWKYIVRTCFTKKPVSYYFDKLFLSQEMGLSKPDAEIYREVLRRINQPADECLFLDDSSVNCLAAEKLGIHTYHVPVRTDFRPVVREML